MQNNGHAGLMEPGGGVAASPPAPAWAGGYGGRGTAHSFPRTSRAKARVALKILHEVMNKHPPTHTLQGPQPSRPLAAHRPGTPRRPASRTGHGATLIYFVGTEKQTGAGDRAAHRGHPKP